MGVLRTVGGSAPRPGGGTLSVLDASGWQPLRDRQASLSFPGTTGTYVSAPAVGATAWPNVLDLRAMVAPTDWTLGASQALLYLIRGSTYYAGFQIAPAGQLLCYLWNGSGLQGTQGAGVIPGVVDGSFRGVRCVITADAGGGNRKGEFYTSPDGITWTLYDTQIVPGAITPLTDANGWQVANRAGIPLNGRLAWAEARNGANGPVIARLDNTVRWSGTQTDSAGNVWTPQGTGLVWS